MRPAAQILAEVRAATGDTVTKAAIEIALDIRDVLYDLAFALAGPEKMCRAREVRRNADRIAELDAIGGDA